MFRGEIEKGWRSRGPIDAPEGMHGLLKQGSSYLRILGSMPEAFFPWAARREGVSAVSGRAKLWGFVRGAGSGTLALAASAAVII